MVDAEHLDTPMELNVKYNENNGDLISDLNLCRVLVGHLIYLLMTRPNLSYVVKVVKQFMSDPQHL